MAPCPDGSIRYQRSWSNVKTALRDETYVRWARRWTKEITCRQTRLFFPTPTSAIAPVLLQMSRTDLGKMVQFLTGHNYLRYHLVKMAKSVDSICRLCEEAEESSWHILTECPVLEPQRRYLFFEHELQAPPRPDQVHLFISDPRVGNLLRHPDAAPPQLPRVEPVGTPPRNYDDLRRAAHELLQRRGGLQNQNP